MNLNPPTSQLSEGAVLSMLPAEQPILYRPEDAARVLGIGRSKLFELLATGQIPSVQIGRARRVSRRALEQYVIRSESATVEGGDGAA